MRQETKIKKQEGLFLSPVSCLLSPVSCLLSPVSCLLRLDIHSCGSFSQHVTLDSSMSTLVYAPQEEVLTVQEEPELEIALPQVFEQPKLTCLRRGKLPNLERRIAELHQRQFSGPEAGPLGPDYQAVVTEFQPLFSWTLASWDYLLTTEGVRFVPRTADEQTHRRGDYRVVTSTDFSRLAHKIFRQCVFEFASLPVEDAFASFLVARFWPALRAAYCRLEEPLDPHQRSLTAYSYLRCIPYTFLNAYHQDLVLRRLRQLSHTEFEAVKWYFLHFFTLGASAAQLARPEDDTVALLQQAMMVLASTDRLVYHLLRQIERY